MTRRALLKLGAAAAVAAAVPAGLAEPPVEVDSRSLGLGRRLLLITDPHIHARPRRDLVEAAERLRPEVTVIAGDLWDQWTIRFQAVLETVEGLARASRWVVAVAGNHEWSAHKAGLIDYHEAVSALEDLRVLYLRDEKVSLSGLIIAGVEWRWKPHQYEEPLRAVGEADVLVAHTPDVFPHTPPRIPVVLAGHTHGGQVCLPGARSVATNSVYGYTWGLYVEEGRVMLLSRGAGEMTPPRVFCRRQIHLVA